MIASHAAVAAPSTCVGELLRMLMIPFFGRWQIADIVAGRAEEGKNYGIVLIPEGLIEHVPQV